MALVRTDISEERIASNFRVTRNGELGSIVAKALCYKPDGRGFETQ
jgi:hypothetical protein